MHVLKRSREIKLPHETFIIDFEVRWNTTFNMLERFLEFKILIDEITINPHVINGLTQSPLKKKLFFRYKRLEFSKSFNFIIKAI